MIYMYVSQEHKFLSNLVKKKLYWAPELAKLPTISWKCPSLLFVWGGIFPMPFYVWKEETLKEWLLRCAFQFPHAYKITAIHPSGSNDLRNMMPDQLFYLPRSPCGFSCGYSYTATQSQPGGNRTVSGVRNIPSNWLALHFCDWSV